jgi:hypothetical protein
MLIRIPRLWSLPVKPSLANCEPWSLLKISGLPRCKAQSRADRQDERQLATFGVLAFLKKWR